MSLPFCARRASGPFLRSAEREIPSLETTYCFATRLHYEKGAGKWAAARKGRSAPAPRVHRRTQTPAFLLKKFTQRTNTGGILTLS